ALSAMDLKDTVNLPRTGFPMRAQLAEREPAQVKAWQEAKVYEQILRKNAGREKFVFHDGPPYANGPIHLGHFLNKVLKDIVVKHASLSGRLAAIARKGALYRRKRPVHWCPRDRTALAEAEVEYAEKTSPSIYVAFRVLDGTRLYKEAPSLKGHPLALAIWTTTPWTIPANF